MHRRSVLLSGAALLLAACGGGGGGGPGITAVQGGAGIAGAPAPAAAPTPPAGLSSNIIAWGDSMTETLVPYLQTLLPNRVVENRGITGQMSTEIAARAVADMEHRNWIQLFWYGHNDQFARDRVRAQIAASVAHLAPGNNRFVVLSVVNRAGSEARGTQMYAEIFQLNSDLALAYPGNFLDIRSFLVSQYDPANAQDVADFNADVPPSSLRNDEIHLVDRGSMLAAQRIKQFIDAKGW